jgi:hypothetical protein
MTSLYAFALHLPNPLRRGAFASISGDDGRYLLFGGRDGGRRTGWRGFLHSRLRFPFLSDVGEKRDLRP